MGSPLHARSPSRSRSPSRRSLTRGTSCSSGFVVLILILRSAVWYLESGRFGPGGGAGEGRTSAHERPRGQARYRECERRREQLPRGCRRLRRGPAGGAAEARLPEGHDEMEDRRHGSEGPDEVERRAPFRVRTEAAGAEEEDRPEDEKEVQGPPGHGARAHSQLGEIGPRVLVLELGARAGAHPLPIRAP